MKITEYPSQCRSQGKERDHPGTNTKLNQIKKIRILPELQKKTKTKNKQTKTKNNNKTTTKNKRKTKQQKTTKIG